MIINMNGGSGGGGATGPLKKAAIVVSYPTGSTCTVTNGSNTYTALDTSGSAAFSVEAGTWTVTATDGTDTASESVTVAVGEWVEVSLFFAFFIFKAGEGQVIPLTAHGAATIETDYISLTNNGNSPSSRVWTTNKLDLTNVSTIYADVNISGGDTTGNYRSGIVVHSAVLGTSAGPHEGTAYVHFETDSTRKVVSLDVSSITGSYYVGLQGQSSGQVYNFYYK